MYPNAAIALAAMSGSPTLGQFGLSHPRLVQRLASLDPVAAVANFAGMLTRPEVRASSLRLEVLVALAVRHGNGSRRPTREMLSRAFKEAGAGWAGRAEDPAEDVVVARVTGARGDFSILPGLAVALVSPVYVNKVFNTDAPIFHALQASFRAVYGSQKGWEFVGIQGLAGLLVLVVAFVTCGLGAFLAVPVYCFYIQNAAYHKGVIS